MRSRSEKGAGKLGSIVGLLLFGGVCLAAWNVVPVYIDNGVLQDKMTELARASRWNHPDEKILDLLMKHVREERLDGYIQRAQFKISTLDTSRRINLDYERPTQILPGWKYKFRFSIQVDQPLL